MSAPQPTRATPFDPARLGHGESRPIGRPRSFEAFALDGPEGLTRPGEETTRSVSLAVQPPDFRPLPGLAGSLVASADANGARIALAGRIVARVETGLALAILDRDGGFLRALEFQAGEAARVPFQEAVYELSGETPCVNLTPDTWSDLGPALATGSWMASLPDVGSVVIETTFDESRT